MVLLMPADRIFIVLHFPPPFRQIPDKEISVIKRLVFGFLIAACQFIIALEQFMGEFFVFQFRFQTVIIGMDVASVPFPFRTCCNSVQVIFPNTDKMFM